MTTENLTSHLAQEVLGWKSSPDRFLTGKRGWIPRWRFQPMTKLEDAFRLLEASRPESCTMGIEKDGTFSVRIQIAGVRGLATRRSKSEAITLAVARAIGLNGEVSD